MLGIAIYQLRLYNAFIVIKLFRMTDSLIWLPSTRVGTAELLCLFIACSRKRWCVQSVWFRSAHPSIDTKCEAAGLHLVAMCYVARLEAGTTHPRTHRLLQLRKGKCNTSILPVRKARQTSGYRNARVFSEKGPSIESRDLTGSLWIVFIEST